MTFNYNPNIPAQDTSVGEWQESILDNFFTLFTAFKKNHVSLDGGVTAGNHTFAEFFKQESPIQTGIDEISIYSKTVDNQTEQLFLRYQNNVEFQLSNYQIYSIPSNVDQTRFFTVLPGKIMFYFGQFTPSANGDILDLTPYVTRNIITISCCVVGTTPNIKPIVQPLTPKKGIYQGIQIGRLLQGNPFPSIYYMVLANI